MEFTVLKENDSVVIKVNGKIDTNTSPALDEAISKEVANTNSIVVDFTNVDYVSSAGLRVLLSAHKAMSSKKGKFVISHVQDQVMELFDMTGFSTFLNIENN